MVTCGFGEASRMNLRSTYLSGGDQQQQQQQQGGEEVDEEEEELTIHTFKINRTGSMMMCTLCDGRVAFFEFGKFC